MVRLSDPVTVEFLGTGEDFQVHLTYPGLHDGHAVRHFHHLGLALPKWAPQYDGSALSVRREHLLPLAWALVRAWARTCLLRRPGPGDGDMPADGGSRQEREPEPLDIRKDRRGEWMPPLHRLVSKHRSYQIAVSTAKRRAHQAGEPMAVVTWHDTNSVVMPAEMARAYDEAELLVEFID